MNEKREQLNPDELSGRDRVWYDFGKEIGTVLCEELAVRDKRLAALERAIKRLERRSSRSPRDGGKP